MLLPPAPGGAAAHGAMCGRGGARCVGCGVRGQSSAGRRLGKAVEVGRRWFAQRSCGVAARIVAARGLYAYSRVLFLVVF